MPHISLVTLGVDDLDAATRFYEALGWQRSPASVPGTVAFLQGGNIALGLFGRADLAADARLDQTPGPGPGAVALAMNVSSPVVVDEVLDVAQGAGAAIPKPAEPADWGGYSGYFLDLDGHLWEVAHNPFFELREDGHVALPMDT